jgi:hypothetical protein
MKQPTPISSRLVTHTEKASSLWQKLELLFVLLTLGLSASAVPVSSPPRVLIIDESVDGGTSSQEAAAAQLAIPGCAVDIVTAANWPGVPPTGTGGPTGFGLDSYRALIIGDPICTGPTTNGMGTSTPGYFNMLNALNATKLIWTPVITGNVILEGVDNAFHAPGLPGADKTLKRGIAFAVNDPTKTGLYYALSCYYDYTAPATNAVVVPHLTAFGTFKVRNYNGICFNDAHIVANHPVFNTFPPLTDAQLSNWGCSTHEGFDQWPPSFIVLAIALTNGTYTATDGSNGIPYILVRGEGVEVISSILLGPPNATNQLGTTHTVCATLGTNVNPRIGVPITFTIAGGPNAVTNYTSLTDTNGVACFTWTGNGGPGVDYVTATYVGEDGHTNQSNFASKYWVTDCAVFGCDHVECLGEGNYLYSFCFTNYSSFSMSMVSLATLPGFNLSSNTFTLNPPLLPNQGTNFVISFTAPAGATNFCFQFTSFPDAGGGGTGGDGGGGGTGGGHEPCIIPHCLALPNCCNRIVTNSLTYVGTSGTTSTYTYQITVQNIGSDILRYVAFAADQPCVTFNPPLVDLSLPSFGGPSLLYPLQSRTLTVQVKITAPCTGPYNFTIAMLNTNFTACCSTRGQLPKAHCITLGWPIDGTAVITNTTILMRALPASTINPCPFKTVAFYMDTTLVGIADRDPFEAGFAPTTPGVFAFTAVATFDSGETETSDPAYVTVVAPGFDEQDHNEPSPAMSATLSGNTVQLGVQTELGHSYYLEYKTNLSQPDWKTLDQAQGDGSIKHFIDNVTNDNSRFYRTRRVP